MSADYLQAAIDSATAFHIARWDNNIIITNTQAMTNVFAIPSALILTHAGIPTRS